jgi:hypothetical protein
MYDREVWQKIFGANQSNDRKVQHQAHHAIETLRQLALYEQQSLELLLQLKGDLNIPMDDLLPKELLKIETFSEEGWITKHIAKYEVWQKIFRARESYDPELQEGAKYAIETLNQLASRDIRWKEWEKLFLQLKLNELTVQVDALCNYLISQDEISPNTLIAAGLIAKLDWQKLVKLPTRVQAKSLEEWFEKVWVVCGSALGSSAGRDPKAIFQSAYLQAKTYEVGTGFKPDLTEEIADKIHQLELLLKLRNTRSHKEVEDTLLFEAADELIQYGHDLKEIILAMLSSNIQDPAYYGAARLSARFQWDEAIDLLIKRLNSHGSVRRKSAQKALIDISKAAVPALIRALSDEDRDICRKAAIVLGNIGPAAQDAVPALIKTLSHWHMSVRAQAAWALGQIGDTAAMDALIKVIKSDKNSKVRRHAVVAISKIDTSIAVNALLPALEDDDRYVRFHAARALNGNLI